MRTWLLIMLCCPVAAAMAVDSTNLVATPKPETAREFYNAGTLALREQKLSDAESQFKAALAKQDTRLQSAALYNLGHVRFAQGAAELKKGPAANKFNSSTRAVSQAGDQVTQQGQNALADGDVQKMLEAYQAGQKVRKEARLTIGAFNRAMEMYAATLRKWRRSLGDFRSAAELNPADTNAVHNAKVVEQEIARLIDSMRQMQQMMMPLPMSGGKSGFGETMEKLKGRIPKEMLPPDDNGDEPGENITPESLKGSEEGPSKDGQELPLPLSPGDIGDLLKGFKFNEKQGLPVGSGGQGEPKDRPRQTW